MVKVNRRRLVEAIVWGLAAPAADLRAQEQGAPIAQLGVFPLLGDGVEVTIADARQDTLVERTRRETLEFRNIGFDIIAGREVRAAMQRHRATAGVAVFGSRAQLPAAEQRRIASGAEGGALPPWMIQVVQQRRLSHVLLLTRQRADVKLLTTEGHTIGRGRVDGLGFYLDPDYNVRNEATGAVATGALGPHAVVQLTLFDTDAAKVVRSYVIDEQLLIGSSQSQAAVDPWSYLSAEQKVKLLRDMLTRALQRVLPEFFKGL